MRAPIPCAPSSNIIVVLISSDEQQPERGALEYVTLSRGLAPSSEEDSASSSFVTPIPSTDVQEDEELYDDIGGDDDPSVTSLSLSELLAIEREKEAAPQEEAPRQNQEDRRELE